MLSAGVTGGRRRPLGVALGLALSFTFATVALVYVIAALGLPERPDCAPWRSSRCWSSASSCCVPPLADRLEAWISRVVPGPARAGGDGFGSGMLARRQPRLRLRAMRRPDPGRGDHRLGRAGLHGRPPRGGARLLARVGDRALPADARRTPNHRPARCLRARVQVAMGAVMIAVAVVMIANLDVRFENAIAGHLPSALVDPTSRIEQSSSVSRGLADLRGGGPVSHEGGTAEAAAGKRLPVYFQAPELHRHAALVQHAGRPAAQPRPAAGAGRPGRLLDLHLHQLHPHAALHRGLVPQVPPRRVHGGRRPHARVPVREGGFERRSGRSATSASPIRSPRTTTTPPGTPTTTSTGRPTT